MTNSIGEIVGNDVLFIIGSNATEAHPIIGNKMKQAHAARRQAHRRRPAPHRAGRARAPLAAAQAGHGRRARQRHDAHHHQRTAGTTRSTSTSAREGFDDLWETVKDYPAERAAEITGVPAETIGAAAELYATTPQGRHLLHPRHHRAHHRHGQRHEPRQPGHGHRPHRRPERRRQPAARPEQRAGRLRHGRAAQLVPGLPERARRRGRRQKFAEAYGVPMPQDMGLRIPEMFELAVHGTLKAMFIMGEDPVLTDADANHVRKALEQPRLPRRAEHLHDRDGQVRRRVPAGGAATRRRTAPSPTPSAACSACARRSSRRATRGPTGRSSRTSASAWASRWHYDSPEDDLRGDPHG